MRDIFTQFQRRVERRLVEMLVHHKHILWRYVTNNEKTLIHHLDDNIWQTQRSGENSNKRIWNHSSNQSGHKKGRESEIRTEERHMKASSPLQNHNRVNNGEAAGADNIWMMVNTGYNISICIQTKRYSEVTAFNLYRSVESLKI